jgi:hypothetical protein
MAIATVLSREQRGIDAPQVRVEVDIGSGLPAFNIIGLPEAVVKESKDRVRAALTNSDFQFPVGRAHIGGEDQLGIYRAESPAAAPTALPDLSECARPAACQARPEVLIEDVHYRQWRNLPLAIPRGPRPQYLSNLAHGQPRLGHGRSPFPSKKRPRRAEPRARRTRPLNKTLRSRRPPRRPPPYR